MIKKETERKRAVVAAKLRLSRQEEEALRRQATEKHLTVPEKYWSDGRATYYIRLMLLLQTAGQRTARLEEEITVGEDDFGEPDPAQLQQDDAAVILLGYGSESVTQIEDALAALAAGKYGLCEECGKAITSARLEINPCATHCPTCQKWLQRERATAIANASLSQFG